jgi:hypothetical protein
MGRSHRLAQRQEVLLTDLSREAIVCFPRELSPRFFDEITRIHQTPEIGARLLETQDPTGAASFTLYASAEAVSVALAPAAAEYVNRYPGALALVPLEAAVPQVPISVVTRQGTDTPELRALAEACRYVAENAADGAD